MRSTVHAAPYSTVCMSCSFSVLLTSVHEVLTCGDLFGGRHHGRAPTYAGIKPRKAAELNALTALEPDLAVRQRLLEHLYFRVLFGRRTIDIEIQNHTPTIVHVDEENQIILKTTEKPVLA